MPNSEENNSLKERIKNFKKRNNPEIKERPGLTAEKVLGEIIGGLIFGFLFGFLIDNYFDTKPIFLLILVILGLAGSIYNIYKEAEKENK